MNRGPRALAGLLAGLALAAPAHAARIQISERTMLDVCREVVRWRATLTERSLSDMGRASARAVAWRIPLRDGVTLGIPRAEVEAVYIETTGERLDTFILEFAGVAERSLAVSHRMADLLANRWTEDGTSYLGLLTEALDRDAARPDCRRGLDRPAAVRASLAQAAAIIYLRADSGAELFRTLHGNRLLVRRYYGLESGHEWVDWNTLVLGTDAPLATAHWRFSVDELGAMAPMAEDDADPADDAPPPALPKWVLALREVILRRDAARLFDLAHEMDWTCSVGRASAGPAWCRVVTPGNAEVETPTRQTRN